MVSEKATIEKALLQDYKAIASIYNEYILEGEATMEEIPHDILSVNKWLNTLTEREEILVLKNEINQVIGWGIIKKYSDREGYSSTCETSVYLTKSEIRKGYGTLIKKRLIQDCKKLGYHHIVAKIWANNIASIEYNRQLGYEVVGIQKEVGRKNGVWIDVMIMQYILR